MTSISPFSGFSSYGIEATNKKMSAEEIARMKKIREDGQTKVTDKFTVPGTQPIDLSNVKKLDISLMDVRKLSDEEMAKVRELSEMPYMKISNLDELKNHVSQQVYAEVKVNGQTIATIYNGGTSMTSNAMGGKINDIINELDSKLSGPEGAQERAEAIAKAFGGEVVMADTAVTQAEYMATPPFIPEYEVDYEAIERDLAAARGQLATPQTQTDTQNLAQADNLKEAGEQAKADFLSFMDKSWEEKIRAMILNSMGIEEEDLQNMSAEEREKIEAKIKEKIEEEIEKKTGMKAGSASSPAAVAISNA